jgi:ATP-dependent exoDNAse (exonuclease V) beta subunit
VVLDTDSLLEEAIDNLLSKTGEDPDLTAVLVEFALEKTDDDKHWNMLTDLLKVGKMLFRENDLNHVKNLEDKGIQDYNALQKIIRKEISLIETTARTKAGTALKLIAESGRSEEDFPNKTLPNHFKKIQSGNFDPETLYKNTLERKLTEGKIVKVNVPPVPTQITESILQHFLEIKKLLYRRALIKNILQNLVPLTILQSIRQELKTIEARKDLLPISSFNSLISNIIGDQPAPFIYERIGEKYRHYFIDEFQDTSQLQWRNLIPLVGNALESLDADGKPGSLLIVGDVKQAIYRWRGGKPEQFLDLIRGSQNPFSVEPSLHSLETNYRSAEEIIKFNNGFFGATSPFLENAAHSTIFSEETRQEFNTRKGGLVQMEFIDCEKEMLDDAYLDCVVDAINTAVNNGYKYRDICVLTRKKKQGVLISQGLLARQIPIVSSETLLLKSSPEVLFLIGLLQCAFRGEDSDARYHLADFLVPKDEAYHSQVGEAIRDLDSWLLENWKFDMHSFRHQSVYDGLEEAIAKFGLVKHSNAFITYFMDEVLIVEQLHGTGISTFLDHWEKKKDKLSITAPENTNAVKIMTIHKAKGLEFPIVIYPYANSNIYEEQNPTLWLNVDPTKYNGFTELLLRKKKQMQYYSESAAELYDQDQYKLELDAFNVLYVALTRAVEGLFIISERDINAKGKHRENMYSSLFKHYLIETGNWSDTKQRYTFGALLPKKADKKGEMVHEMIAYRYSTKEDSAPKMVMKSAEWDDSELDPRRRGTLIHYIMSLIKTEKDVEPALAFLQSSGVINADEVGEFRELVLKIVHHPELIHTFKEGVIVKNEQEIIAENGLILRPDRLVFQGRQVTIVDYKTGSRSADHRDQLLSYGNTLENMGYELAHSIIVYIDENINTEYIQ